jgi:hypothetical protein
MAENKNITLKRFNGTDYDTLFPATTPGQVQGLLSGGKIDPALLPNSVFDSLYFFNTFAANTNLSALAAAAIADATTRSPIGYYWVSTVAVTLTADTVTSGTYYTTSFSAADGTVAPTSTPLEIGDWVVLTNLTGAGTSGSPYLVKFAVVNNTYELATTTTPGIMSAADKTKLDGIAASANNYVHPAYTTRSIDTDGVDVLDVFTSDAIGSVTNITKRTLPTATTSLPGVMSAADKTKLDGIAASANNYVHPNHSGDVTSVGDGAQTIAANAVTNTKLNDMAANTIKGRITASTGDPEDLTAAQIRTIINVADGANNYTHPAYTARSIDADGVEVIDTFTSDAIGSVTAITKRTLPNASTSAAGVMSAADKTKLDGIATGATAYVLPLAANGTRGGIQIGATETETNRAVILTSEKASVALPRQIPAVTLNGASTNTPGFYAPTTSGTAASTTQTKQFALAGGTSVAPVWTDMPKFYYNDTEAAATTAGVTLGDILFEF